MRCYNCLWTWVTRRKRFISAVVDSQDLIDRKRKCRKLYLDFVHFPIFMTQSHNGESCWLDKMLCLNLYMMSSIIVKTKTVSTKLFKRSAVHGAEAQQFCHITSLHFHTSIILLWPSDMCFMCMHIKTVLHQFSIMGQLQ